MSEMDLSSYGIGRHSHLFSAWAASRAASVKGCRFSVEQGRHLLETAGFTAGAVYPDALPATRDVDEAHKKWRTKIIEEGAVRGLCITHGVAAKLINVYLKSRIVCGGFHDNERVRTLHPPIDEVLLRTLAVRDVGGFGREWRKACRRRWSKLTSHEYDELIAVIRRAVGERPMWAIEAYWRGNQ